MHKLEWLVYLGGGLFDYVRISCCLQKIAISRETCYAAGVDSRKHGRFWAVEEFHSKGEGGL